MILFHKKCHQLYQKFVFGGVGPREIRTWNINSAGGTRKGGGTPVSPQEGVERSVRGQNRGF